MLKKNEHTLRDMWRNIKCTNIYIMGLLEGEERENGEEKIFEENMAPNCLNFMKNLNL